VPPLEKVGVNVLDLTRFAGGRWASGCKTNNKNLMTE